MPAGDSASAIVVGAGILGACLADELAGRGWAVTLLDQAPPGHARATSGGDTRILRCGHGAADWYARSARTARARWLQLEHELGEPLYHETGVSWLARREDGIEATTERTLTELDIPVQRVDPVAAAELLPGLRPDGLAFVLHEPEAGFLRARRALALIAARAQRERGVQARFDVLARPTADGGVVVPDRAETLHADAVVWATGPWLAQQFGELAPLRVLRRDYAYLAAPPAWRAPPQGPWVDYDAAVYGLGDFDGLGAKVASDSGEERFDPQTGNRGHDPRAEAAARAYLARRFPELARAPLVGWKTCQYELTADTEFLIARVPGTPSTWLLGGGSGHAFKHGPSLGAYVADLLESGGEPDPRFAAGQRSGGTSLITAGENALISLSRSTRPRG